MAGLIALDAGVLIAQFDEGDGHHERAQRLLRGTQGRGLRASPLTLAEVLVRPSREGRAEDIRARLRRLDVVAVPLDDDSPSRLAELRVATRLKLPDCCVLLAAEQAEAEVATFDTALAGAARELGLPVRLT